MSGTKVVLSAAAASPTPSGRVLRYARVSTAGQLHAVQLEPLHAAGAERLFREPAFKAQTTAR